MTKPFADIFPELDLAIGGLFSPAQIAELTGVSEDNQRLWRSRLKGKISLPQGAPYLWHEVMQWALLKALFDRGIPLAGAAAAAMSKKLEQLHGRDFRRPDGPHLYLLMKQNSKGEFEEPSTFGDREKPEPEWLGGYGGFYLSYSAIQRDVVAAYEKIRSKRKPEQ